MENKKIVYVFTALIINESKDSFLSVNRNEKELQMADKKWELPGGKLEFGETPFQAVEREVLEETGYQVKAISLLPFTYTNQWIYPDGEQVHAVIICCLCKVLKKINFKIVDHKVNDVKWIHVSELNKYDFMPGTVKLLNKYFGGNKNV